MINRRPIFQILAFAVTAQLAPIASQAAAIGDSLPPSLLTYQSEVWDSGSGGTKVKIPGSRIEPDRFKDSTLVVEVSPKLTYAILHEGAWRVFFRNSTTDPYQLWNESPSSSSSAVDALNMRLGFSIRGNYKEGPQLLARALFDRQSWSTRKLSVYYKPSSAIPSQLQGILKLDHVALQAAQNAGQEIDFEPVIAKLESRKIRIHESETRMAHRGLGRIIMRAVHALDKPIGMAALGYYSLNAAIGMQAGDPLLQAHPNLTLAAGILGLSAGVKAFSSPHWRELRPNNSIIGRYLDGHPSAKVAIIAGLATTGVPMGVFACKLALHTVAMASKFVLPQ